jgi:hypothetical protein
MDPSKILALVCAVLLLICLLLSITSLSALRSVQKENERQTARANELIGELRDCAAKITAKNDAEEDSPTQDTQVQVTAPAESFCVKDTNGRIGVFTSDGYLVRFLDVSVDALPPADREALRVGITVGSWRELMSVIQDYTS